jgi:hypothetical protein
MPPSVLFLADPDEDYMADTLFHGLRSLLGANAVDFPKRASLYDSYPEERRAKLYGRGFAIYGLLEDIEVGRDDALARAEAGEFDVVIFGTIWRDWHWWVDLRSRLPATVRKAAVDGADVPWMYPYGPTWWKTPRGWVLPRAHRSATYFKREWTRATGWLRWWGLVPPPFADRVPLEPIAISLPAEKVVAELPEKSQQFGRHVVDLEMAERLGRSEMRHERSYSFERESDYVADLRASRFGITTKRAGWDALRHYEIAAAGAVPCFRDLARKPPHCAPHGLRPGVNCIAYEDADDLMRQVEGISEDAHLELAAGALEWARSNTTRSRAEQVLRTLGIGLA